MEEKIRDYYVYLNDIMAKALYKSIAIHEEYGDCPKVEELTNRCVGLQTAIRMLEDMFKDELKRGLY